MLAMDTVRHFKRRATDVLRCRVEALKQLLLYQPAIIIVDGGRFGKTYVVTVSGRHMSQVLVLDAPEYVRTRSLITTSNMQHSCRHEHGV